ncbi:MAG: peptide chain release factor N(5)-glutamine methyltransferase [Anaerolineales bacterium]|nr:peptide chain release factor N(5)-glutamine methyltransferase [Anaerolineales bacterium]
MTNKLSEIANRLALFSDSPELDASVLLAQIVGKPRTWVMAHPEITLTTDQKKTLIQSIKRLGDGESFPYVIGHWEFFGLDLDITPDVLIPRPETELLVEKAIAWLQISEKKSPSMTLKVADIGTGSGAIAISIALHIPNACIIATDISSAALNVAKRNAKKFNVQDKIEFIECDILPAPSFREAIHHPLSFDLICANLPYIPSEILQDLPIYGREPTLALDGGADGLDLFRRLLDIAPDWLAPHGMILLEIEATRGVEAMSLACDIFSSATIHLHQDFTGRDRLLEIML